MLVCHGSIWPSAVRLAPPGGIHELLLLITHRTVLQLERTSRQVSNSSVLEEDECFLLSLNTILRKWCYEWFQVLFFFKLKQHKYCLSTLKLKGLIIWNQAEVNKQPCVLLPSSAAAIVLFFFSICTISAWNVNHIIDRSGWLCKSYRGVSRWWKLPLQESLSPVPPHPNKPTSQTTRSRDSSER